MYMDLYPKMIRFYAVYFSECHSKQVACFFWHSVHFCVAVWLNTDYPNKNKNANQTFGINNFQNYESKYALGFWNV